MPTNASGKLSFSANTHDSIYNFSAGDKIL
uniref:Uncharacterized protein n=1 Tax=Arundo donax TaxID=35708 RepID=A0A0A9GRD9_ARUDO